MEIWLTNGERRDASLRERLRPLYQRYKGTKYLVAVYESGGEDLEELTGALLRYSRKRFARTEVELEKLPGPAPAL